MSVRTIKRGLKMKLYKSKKDKEVYYYFLKNGKKRWLYRHKYYDSLGKRREKKKSGFTTEKEALRSLLEVKTSTLSGQTKHIEHSQITVEEWLDIWYETKHRSWKVTTEINYKSSINHLKKLIGKYKLNSLTRSTYEREFINKLLDDGFSPRTVRGYHDNFKSAINYAVEDEILQKNRFSNIRIEHDCDLENFLTPEELVVFLKYAKKFGNETQYTLTLLLAYTGLRKGEALGLKWEDIDFVNHILTVERTRCDLGPRTPKTKNSYRSIEVDEMVINELKKYQKWCIELKLSNGVKHKKSDYIFITENNIDGTYSAYINHFFKLIYSKLESDKIKVNVITPHGLRHTHATILIDELIPPTDIADRLGNTLEMIYRVYAHSFKKIENKTVIAFGKRLNSHSS